MNQMHDGFSLIEVLIALAMVSITITSLLSLQQSLQTMLYKDTTGWKAQQLALEAFADAYQKEPLEVGKKIEHEEDGFTITYSVKKPQEGTLLGGIQELVIEKVSVSWAGIIALQSYSLMKLSYRQKPPEKETNNDTHKAEKKSDTAPAGSLPLKNGPLKNGAPASGAAV